MIPETAAGTTTRVAVCIFVEPSAYEPSRRSRGTLPIASSESDATVGISITPITMPPESALKISDVDPDVAKERRHEGEREVAEDDRRHAGQHLEPGLQDPAHARVPRTRSGRSPSRARGAARRARRSPVTTSVPPTRGRTPKCAGSNSGDQSRAGEEVDDRDLLGRTRRPEGTARSTIPTVVATEIERTKGEDALDDVLADPPTLRAGAGAARRL